MPFHWSFGTDTITVLSLRMSAFNCLLPEMLHLRLVAGWSGSSARLARSIVLKRPPSRMVSPCGALSEIFGGSLMERTSKRAVLETLAPSGSVTVNVMFAAPFQNLFGIAMVATWFLSTVTLRVSPAGALGSSALAFLPFLGAGAAAPTLIGFTSKLQASSVILWSGSFTSSASLICWNCFFSSMVWSLSSLTNAGASFTDSTVNFTLLLAAAPSGSVTVNFTVSEPCQFGFGGVTVTLWLASMATLSSLAPSIFHLSLFFGWSRSSTKLSRAMDLKLPFSLMVWSAMSFMTGGSLMDFTVKEAVALAEAPSGSVTVNVSFSVPFHIGFGVETVVLPSLPMETFKSLLPETSILSFSNG